MKLPKELKRYANKARSKIGKKNGVVKWLFDHPDIEKMLGKNKKSIEKRLAKQNGEL